MGRRRDGAGGLSGLGRSILHEHHPGLITVGLGVG
jgi:hypothetical protein